MTKTIVSAGYDNAQGGLVVQYSDGTTGAAVRINGSITAVPAGAVAYKYADPTEGARWLYSDDEADEIESDDPSLIVRFE